MKTDRMIAGLLLAGAVMAGAAFAQSGDGASYAGLNETGPMLAQAGPAAGAPSASPSDRPVPPPAQVQPQAINEAPAEEQTAAEEEKEWRLFKSPCLEEKRIDIRGWLEQGYTWNPDRPADRFNGPVGYNDRSNEYMLNQLYLIGERVTKTDGCGWDLGGRVDLLYGEDWRFPQSFGLDNEWNKSERFYGLSMPQFYGDIAVNNLILRGGHFLAPCGYESVMAPSNFFYSHSYEFLYGQPTTVSGGQMIYKLNDCWSFNGGIDTGWNDWELKNDKMGYFFGANWTGPDQKSTLALEFFIGNEQLTGESTRTHYCLVYTRKLTDKLTYAFEHNLGYETNAVTATGRDDAEWLGFANYLTYDLNDCWSVGARYEIFSDDDGTLVNGLGYPHGIGFGAIPAVWNDLSLGVNYKPNKNVLVRSEVRWDWIDARGTPAPATLPFDDRNDSQQFLWGTDLILKF